MLVELYTCLPHALLSFIENIVRCQSPRKDASNYCSTVFPAASSPRAAIKLKPLVCWRLLGWWRLWRNLTKTLACYPCTTGISFSTYGSAKIQPFFLTSPPYNDKKSIRHFRYVLKHQMIHTCFRHHLECPTVTLCRWTRKY